jgi:hypothetical protein
MRRSSSCAGFQNLTSMDWSGVVIDIMKDEYEDIPELKCK